MLTSRTLPIPGHAKVEIERKAERRRRAAFTIGFVVLLAIVSAALLWALKLL
jgi:hypothetical protein